MAKKVKLTKEEKKQRKKEAAERRQKEELEARLLAEQQQQQLEQQLKAERERQLLREAEERVLRREQLTSSARQLQLVDTQLDSIKQQEHQLDRWNLYLSCDGLPDPLSQPQLNAFISECDSGWLLCDNHDDTVRRCGVVLRVIARLQAALDGTDFVDCAPHYVASMRAVLKRCQDLLQQTLDVACYRVLIDLRPLIDLETNTVQFCRVSQYVTMALWSNCSKNLKNKGYAFKELGVKFELPRSLLDKDIAVRVLHTEYDFLSRQCPSHRPPALAEQRMSERLFDVILADDERVVEELVAAEAAAEAAAQAAEAARQQAELENEAANHANTKQPTLPTTPTPAKSPSPKAKHSPKKTKARKKSPRRKGGSKSPSPKRAVPPPEELVDPQPVIEPVPSLMTVTATDELNLRRYRVIGGLFHLHLVHLPCQPLVVNNWTLRRVDDVQNLCVYPFEADYSPPATDTAGGDDSGAVTRREPHEIERQIKQREAEMQKLVALHVENKSHTTLESNQLPTNAAASITINHKTPASTTSLPAPSDDVTAMSSSQPNDYNRASPFFNYPVLSIRLSDDVLWFEPPVFARWDETRGFWSTEGFHETRYNEDTLQIQTRTVRLGVIGLAVNRFSNLPLQSWSLSPLTTNSARLKISAAIATVSILIQGNRVSLEEMTGGSSSCLEAFYNQPMKSDDFIELLRSRGLDLFPAADSHVYVAGTPLKHSSCEQHLYRCVASIAGGYRLSSSRWNLLAGSDRLVLLFREVVGLEKQGNDATLLVQPRRTTIVQCTESSSAFSDEEAEGIAFFADLLHLVDTLGSTEARACIAASSLEFTDCVFSILSSLRLLSYS